MIPKSIERLRWRACVSGCAILAVAQLSACGLLNSTLNAPANVASTLSGAGDKDAAKMPAKLLQTGLMRFADTFAAKMTEATKDFAAKSDKPEAQIQAMSWAVGQITAAFTIATGPNTNVDLLDMTVMVTLGRMTHEEYWLPKVWGEADRPMLDAFTALEKDIWDIAAHALTEQHQADLRATIRAWREQNPDMGVTAFVRLPAFEELLSASKQQTGAESGGLSELLRIDPLSGIDPAVREIEQTRMFAERALYYAQRMPLVFSTQVELLALKLSQMPSVQGALADTERISKAATSISETAATLPNAVRAEREAAVKQIADELTAQRQGLVADLEKAEAPTREMLTNARAALDSGEQMSVALKGTIESFDTMLGNMTGRGKSDAKPAAAPAPALDPDAPPAKPGKPFDITEYGDVATRLTATAHELTGLISTLDTSMPKVQSVLRESVEHANGSVDHALDRALRLGLILIASAALAVLLVRWISKRWLNRRSAGSAV
jgi:hypothetical protein